MPDVQGLARIGGGAVPTACGVLTPRFGGRDAKTHRWAGLFLFLAAVSLTGGIRELRTPGSART